MSSNHFRNHPLLSNHIFFIVNAATDHKNAATDHTTSSSLKDPQFFKVFYNRLIFANITLYCCAWNRVSRPFLPVSTSIHENYYSPSLYCDTEWGDLRVGSFECHARREDSEYIELDTSTSSFIGIVFGGLFSRTVHVLDHFWASVDSTEHRRLSLVLI